MSDSKSFPDDNRFIWLSGAYLSSRENIPSPFQTKPSALVRNHFFEPALVTFREKVRENDKEKDQDLIYEGSGYERVERKAGSQRVKIIKYDRHGTLVWLLKKENTPIAIGPEHEFVEYALSNCVQVCLAMEPLFAVALSLSSRIGSSSRTFRKSFVDFFPETRVQRTKGQVDGEVHELIIFAALQSASNGKFDTPTTVKQFVEKLNEFLKIDYSERNSIISTIIDELENKKIDGTRKRVESDRKVSFQKFEQQKSILKDTEERLDTTHMPWLVPACEKKMLENKIKDYGKDFFGDLSIAGLVPGTGTSPMDAKAYRWKNYTKKGGLQTDWSFEFKARGCSYPMDKAKKDLMAKCQDDIKCHAMLIGITNKRKSECNYGVVKINGEFYLRVVLLVGNKC